MNTTNNNQNNHQLIKQNKTSNLEKRKVQLVEALSKGNRCSPDNPFQPMDQTHSKKKKKNRKEKLLQIKPNLSLKEKDALVVKYWKKVCSIESKEELVDRAYEWMLEFNEDIENPTTVSPAFELYSLHEFENGQILAKGFTEDFQPLVRNLSIEIQKEYACVEASEKSLAHLIAQTFCRALELQYSFNIQYNAKKQNDYSLKTQLMICKEYDRSIRQYLSCMQTLKSFKQSPIKITVKTNTANIANQQIVQENNNA
jgi:hypothetical protein